jgi:excisionase family DNA binding protein
MTIKLATYADASTAVINGRSASTRPIRFYCIPEIAEITGVSRRTVRRWIEKKELIAHRLGRSVRIAEPDLKNFLAQHRDC